MSDNKVYMFVPPAHDWGMPLIALPLLKTYVKQNGPMSRFSTS